MIRLLLLTLSLTLAVSRGAPPRDQGQGERVEIIKSLAEQKSDGSYFFAYEGADGSYREEVGILKRLHNEISDDEEDNETELEISGVYRYTDSNGKRVEVSYVADKNGFVPVGTNIPREITDTARNAVRSLEVRANSKN